jgi:hypothetical protein
MLMLATHVILLYPGVWRARAGAATRLAAGLEQLPAAAAGTRHLGVQP